MERMTKRYVYDEKNYISVDSKKSGISCSNFCTNCGKADCEDIRKALFRLAEYEDLKEHGKLLKLPCALGDFALFSDKRILPVTFISKANEGIIVGCQNGIRISMDSQYGDWCKGFYRTREEAEERLKEL